VTIFRSDIFVLKLPGVSLLTSRSLALSENNQCTQRNYWWLWGFL